MSTQLADFNWGTSPKYPVTFSYDRRRSGTSMQYKIYVHLGSLGSSSWFGYSIGVTIKLDSVTKVNNHTIKATDDSEHTSYDYDTGWLTVSDKSSGSTSLSITLTTNAPRGNSSYSYSLTVDPGKSTLTYGTFTVGSATAITVNQQSSSFTHTVKWVAGSMSGTICTKSSTTSLSWTIPITMYMQMVGKSSISGTLSVTTYSGNTDLGTNSYSITINAASVYRIPTITNFTFQRGELIDMAEDEFEPDPKGQDLKIVFDVTVSSVANPTYQRVKLGDDIFIYTGGAVPGHNVFYWTSIGTSVSYELTAEVSDAVGSIVKKSLIVPTLAVPYNINVDLPGAAYGKIAETAKRLELGVGWELSLGGHFTPVGSVIPSGSSTVSVPTNGVDTVVTSLEIPAGTWLIIGGITTNAFDDSTVGGAIWACLNDTQTVSKLNPANNDGFGTATFRPYGSSTAICGEVVSIRHNETPTTIYLVVDQSTSDAISVTGAIRAVRIA